MTTCKNLVNVYMPKSMTLTIKKPHYKTNVMTLTNLSWNLLRVKRIWINYLNPNTCPLTKKVLNLTMMTRKDHINTSLLKRHHKRTSKVGLAPKPINLITITKSHTIYHYNHNYLGHRHPSFYGLNKDHKQHSQVSGKRTSYSRIIQVYVPKGSIS